MNDETPPPEPYDLQRVPRRGTSKMVTIVILVPIVVLFAMWALVRITALPQVPTGEIIGSRCDTTDTVTTFRGQLDPESLTSRDFNEAILRVEFFAFLVREESMQRVRPSDVDATTGLIEVEITQEIEGPANCEIISFLPE